MTGRYYREEAKLRPLAETLKASCSHGRTPLDIFRTLVRVHAAERHEIGRAHPVNIGIIGTLMGLSREVVRHEAACAEHLIHQCNRAQLGGGAFHGRNKAWEKQVRGKAYVVQGEYGAKIVRRE